MVFEEALAFFLYSLGIGILAATFKIIYTTIKE